MAYFDHAATQPMRRSAVEAWVAASGALNSGAQYASGRHARSLLDDARETVAELLGCEPIEVIFTSSGTEADNIAVQGLYAAAAVAEAPGAGRVVTTRIEHSAVKEPVAALHAAGAHVDFLDVGRSGHVERFDALDTPAALATCMWANNETGAIQPITKIVERARATGTPVHTDAVQVVGKQPVNFAELGVTTLAASAHKFGGPRGTGLLLAQRTPAPLPVMRGGGQERGIRPGTVDVASASALAAALRESLAESAEEAARVARFRDQIREYITDHIPGSVINTTEPALPGHLHVSFERTDGDSLILLLDQLGIEAATGSACNAGVNRMSHVLEAMGVEESLALGSLRFTLGPTTTQGDVDKLLAHLPEVIERARLVHG